MKMINKIWLLVLLMVPLLIAQVKIIVFDASGSFIGPNAPLILKQGSLQRINEIISFASPSDTIIFFTIRENSTLSSLNQIILMKEKAKKVFDPTIRERNKKLISTFARKILDEINKPYSRNTDIISAINFASSIAKNYRSAHIYVFSDGDDNVNAKLFNRLDNIAITHLFIFHKNPEQQNTLVHKWKKIYQSLGAKELFIYDAQASQTAYIGGK